MSFVYKQVHSEVPALSPQTKGPSSHCPCDRKAADEHHSSTTRKGGLSRSKTVPFFSLVPFTYRVPPERGEGGLGSLILMSHTRHKKERSKTKTEHSVRTHGAWEISGPFFYHLPSDGMEDVDQACVVVDPHVALSHCLGLRGGLPQGKALHLDKRGSGTAAERQRNRSRKAAP